MGVEETVLWPGDAWPVAISDGLTLPCGNCGEIPKFDYHVTDEYWAQVVGEEDRLGVICLPCLAERCDGIDLAAHLEFVQFVGPGVTIELKPTRAFNWKSLLEIQRG